MIPVKYNMVCPSGSTFKQQLACSVEYVVMDLTGYTARMQVKERYESTRGVFYLTTENGGLTIDGPLGTIDIFIPATDTGIAAKDYVYGLEIESPSGEVTRLLEGKFIVTPGVRR